VFAASIIGILLKQLRLLSDSIGIFEIAGLIVALYFIVTNRERPTKGDLYFGGVFLVILFSFCCGAALSFFFFREHFSVRDLMATFYITVIVLGWLNFTEGSLLDRIELYLSWLSGYCAIIILLGVTAYRIAPGLWYFDVYFGRFMGLSDNPNQLGSLCATGMALVALAAQLRGRVSRLGVARAAAISIAGLLTQSVAFIASTALSALVVGLLYVWQATLPNSIPRRLSAFLIAAVTAAALMALAFFAVQIVDAVIYLYSGGSGKGSVRLQFWIEAFNMALRSPIFGLGPGGHVPVDFTTELQEAHNIFIELLVTGGLVSLLAFVMLLCAIGLPAIRYRFFAVTYALLTLILLGSFHTVLRHAHYWIAIHATLSTLFLIPERSQRPRVSRPS